MRAITKKADMEKLKALVATYHGAQKAKKMAESQMDELRPTILQLINVLGDRSSPSTKRVHVDGLNVDARDTGRVYPVDGAVEYVLDKLSWLRPRLLEMNLNIKGVESAAADDVITSEDLENLVTTKSTTSLYVTEVKAKK